MRLLLPLSLLLLGSAAAQPRPATPDEIALLRDAINNTQQDTERWAYTETTVKKVGIGKKPEGETIVRFDPSKPWAEQYTPLKIEGKPPTERQLKQYRERGEKRGKAISRRAEQAAAVAADPTTPTAPRPLTDEKRRERTMRPDLDHPLVVSADGETTVFEIPLIDKGTGIPAEKIEVRAVVATTTRQVRQVAMRVKEAFRVKLVAKVKEGEAEIDFTVIDPKYAPVMTSATGNLGASMMFVPVNGIYSSHRTDFQRVKPYSERLQVKLGPLEMLDF
jgi:hypothetical protein